MEQRGGRGGADDKTEGQKEKADSIYVYQCTIKQVSVSFSNMWNNQGLNEK